MTDIIRVEFSEKEVTPIMKASRQFAQERETTKINFFLLLVLHARSAISFSFEAIFEIISRKLKKL